MLTERSGMEATRTDIRAYINPEERAGRRWDLFEPWFLFLNTQSPFPPSSAQNLNFISETFVFLTMCNLGETVNQGTHPP